MKSKHTLLLLFALPLRAWSEIGFRFQLVPCREISCSSTCSERKEISLALFSCHWSNRLLPNPHCQLVSSPTSSSSYVYFAVHWLVRYTEKSFSFVFFRGRCKLWFWTVRIIQHLKRHSPFVTKHRNRPDLLPSTYWFDGVRFECQVEGKNLATGTKQAL